MKKAVAIVILIAMILSCFVGCSPKTVDWLIDRYDHWQLDDNGIETERQPHKMKNGVCTVCGTELEEYEDELWAVRYSDRGDLVAMVVYDQQMNVVSNTRIEYTYDSEDICTQTLHYSFGKLVEKRCYATVTFYNKKTPYLAQKTTYGEDGSWHDEFYDYGGYVIRQVQYNYDGSMVFDYTYENVIDQDGRLGRILKFDGESLVEQTAFTYDQVGNITQKQLYSGETLVRDEYYATAVKEDETIRYLSVLKQYEQDGSVSVIYYDSDGNIVNTEDENDEN